jgi:hypothetical protein
VTHHIEHGDTHTEGLHDDCPRCAEHAAQPTGLDAENLRRIWSGDFKTRTDAEAYNVMYRSVVLWQRLVEAYQWEDFDGYRRKLRDEDFGEAVRSFQPKPASEIDLFRVGGRR